MKLKFLLLAVSVIMIEGAAQAGQCRDPWVTSAIQQVTGRAPNDSGENGACNIYNFNGGRWGSYNELLGYVRNYYSKKVTTAPTYNSGLANSALINNNSSGLISKGGAGIVAAGGLNNSSGIVAAGGLNNSSGIVAAGGLNNKNGAGLIGTDGSTLIGNDGASFRK